MKAQPVAPNSVAQFDEWAQTHCVFRDRSWGGLKSLYDSFFRFCVGRNPCSRDAFEWILQDQGFEVNGNLVYGLISADDEPLTQGSESHTAIPRKITRIQPFWHSEEPAPNAQLAAHPSLRKELSSKSVQAYYVQVLARHDLRRQTVRDWTARCPEHDPISPSILTINFENGGFKCSDRYCDLSWGGRNIFHFEMARLRRENGSVPGCTFVAQSIHSLIEGEASVGPEAA